MDENIIKLLQEVKQQITQDYAEMNASVQRSIDKVDDIIAYINENYLSDV